VAQVLPRNTDVAERLELLADLLELDGEASFRVVAYRRAATRIRETSGSVAELALAGKAKDLSGIGRTIEEKIVQLVETGDIEALAKRRSGVPPEVVLFMRLPGLGPKTAAKIWRDLGIETLEELEAAAKEGRLRALPGLGARTEERIVKALADAAAAVDEPVRTLLGRALPAVEAVVATLLEHPAADRVSAAGSIRRRRETVRDLDLIATSPAPADLTGYFTKLAWVVAVEAHGDSKAVVVSNDGLRFDLRVVPPESYGNLLQHFTGSARHNVALREAAVRRGLSVSEYGVEHVESGEVFRTTSEEQLYEHLGYAWIPPELREDAGELQAARDGALPTLVEAGELRGDLHSHTTWSTDAKGSLEEMVAAARARGYEYLAVTDHAHYLRDGKLERQQEEIEALAKRATPFRILRGVEVSIRADGTLDLADELLARCDWVVASLHAAFSRSPTERILEAMEHPAVDVIGHPTTRKLNKRGGAEIDLERVIDRALGTGTFLEINSQPDRLDLRDVDARAVGEAGVPLVVSSDAHSVGALGYVELGISQARRAWLTRSQIVNTRSWTEVEALRKQRG
jgi:DNA polymerase (family 10)